MCLQVFVAPNLRYSYHLVINELLFSGNILREFYPEGALKSEAEIKEGKRHGRYREYYENGKLKFRGKYANNQPKGTWKYYIEEGEFERKEKH